jgi:hypothetical protein
MATATKKPVSPFGRNRLVYSVYQFLPHTDDRLAYILPLLRIIIATTTPAPTRTARTMGRTTVRYRFFVLIIVNLHYGFMDVKRFLYFLNKKVKFF